MKKIFLLLFCLVSLIQLAGFADNTKTIIEKINILKAKDIEHREKWQAHLKLVKIGKESVMPLIEALKDENAKYYAIRTLGEIGDDRAVEPLCSILLDKNYVPRRYAAVALGRIKSPKAIPALKEALNDDKKYVGTDALIALQQINPQETNVILKEQIFKQDPNGLEVKISSLESKGNDIKIKVIFKNISQSNYSIQFPEIYKAAHLIAEDTNGAFIRPIQTVKYGYVTTETEFHLIEKGKSFSLILEGKIKESLPALISRSSILIDWWEVIYPKGFFKTIDFGDMALDVGISKSKTFKMYFIFEQGETAKTWGKKFGFDTVWTGRAISNPIEITLE